MFKLLPLHQRQWQLLILHGTVSGSYRHHLGSDLEHLNLSNSTSSTSSSSTTRQGLRKWFEWTQSPQRLQSPLTFCFDFIWCYFILFYFHLLSFSLYISSNFNLIFVSNLFFIFLHFFKFFDFFFFFAILVKILQQGRSRVSPRIFTGCEKIFATCEIFATQCSDFCLFMLFKKKKPFSYLYIYI